MSVVAALVPSLAIAQQRPASPPPASPRPAGAPTQRPTTPPARPAPAPAAARPMMAHHMGGERDKAWTFGIQGGIMYLDNGVLGTLISDGIHTSTGRVLAGGAANLGKQLSKSVNLGVGLGFFTGASTTALNPRVDLTFSTDVNKKMVWYVPVGGSVTRFSGNGGRLTSQW
ncbi:MAG TPA: hypothetical protein VGI92_09840, partial [Gemmatimonadales bacterium]